MSVVKDVVVDVISGILSERRAQARELGIRVGVFTLVVPLVEIHARVVTRMVGWGGDPVLCEVPIPTLDDLRLKCLLAMNLSVGDDDEVELTVTMPPGRKAHAR